ncbi:hypothetical protein QAD02_019423 [Eretmocerus hayati]|uniref:Uncharacterized protein n=1 Tax=Eretmocerus hayati TaxID=131215 RepID=A0ACC2PJK3_9HYME|nr:hypothetical protein QAD02_019423 [Eretmocerus hayati]
MFKLESYITPVILSYVEKYVKNFKPEQSQVSLWGGDASFQNLDLRLEVLEEQLNLPFTFVSGHIHELLIHVPWVKITSEPIVVTINTIECILKLKDGKQSENVSTSSPVRQIEIPQEEAPQGYIKSIVTKVINNITINCNNLILKYVEEDIVLSINVRFLSMQTVNNKWEPTFTDMSSYEAKLQKIITVQDLTLCLDKMDTSGKIEIYQDPVLYRCSMTIRVIMNYLSSTAKRASITRLDLHCQKMEFSVTEQQIPMILRLYTLLTLLQSKQFPSTKVKTTLSNEEIESASPVDELVQLNNSAGDPGWGMWAWNTMSSLIPVDWDTDWSEDEQLAHSGHVVHVGCYIDDAMITFKTVESVKEQLFYKSRKMKYKSFLSLRFSGAVLDAVLQGISMSNFTIGCGSVQLYPRGTCSCGYLEVVDGAQPPLYLIAGIPRTDYLKDTLFDIDALENQGKKRIYKKDVPHYLASTPMTKLLEKCPAFCMDYTYYIEIPENITPEEMAAFSTSYEFSNFHEERHVRYGVGNVTVRVCSGLFHRIDTIKKAASKYDYSPYTTPKPVPSFEELPPVTVEEYEALRENIPIVKTEYHIVKSAVQLQLADHRITGLPRQRKYVENRTMPLTPALSDDPFLNLECDSLLATLEQPLYPFRVIACASKQDEVPPEMLIHCYRCIKIEIEGASSQILLKPNCRSAILLPCNVEYSYRSLLYPDYWKNPSTIHKSHNLKLDAITMTGTKKKVMVATSIISSLLHPEDTSNPLICSSLYTDACDERSPTYLEIYFENINHKGLMSLSTTSCITHINAVKIFAHDETHQTFILSGPEVEEQSESISSVDNQILMTVVVQFSNSLDDKKHPPIFSFQMAPMRGSLDPLLLRWLDYRVTYYKLNTTHAMKPEAVPHSTESAISDSGGKKRNFPSLNESVHSSSDKEKRKIDDSTERSHRKSLNKTNESDKLQSRNESTKENLQKKSILVRLTEMYPWWSGLVLHGSIGHVTIYIPTKTISGIGAEGIEQAKDQALQNDRDLQILVLKTPILKVHSSNIQPDHLSSYIGELPITLPKRVWMQQTHSCPWTLEILNLECFTLKSDMQRNFIKKICFKATLDLTAKESTPDVAKNKSPALSLCLYIDTSPIVISVSEEQVTFLNQISVNILNTVQSILPQKIPSSTTNVREIKDISLVVPLSPSSPTQVPYLEDTTTTSTISTIKDNRGPEDDDSNLTASIQWTIAKVVVKLYALGDHEEATSKLVLELEDIITSVDMQSVYLKLKHKITTATVFHYTRDLKTMNWDFGDYVGLILCGRDDNLEKNEDLGFLSLTLTVAKSGNVFTRWCALKSHKSQRQRDPKIEALQTSDTYVTEAIVKIQMTDLIVPPSSLIKYTQLLKPFLVRRASQNNLPSYKRNFEPPLLGMTSLRNETLPLIYLDFKGFRLMLPAKSDVIHESQHDLLMLQVDNIRIAPIAENPICRVPMRPEIYQSAAQANILNVPGSAVEDRQYQINVDGICAHTTTWKDYQQSVAKRMSQSYLYTMNENPAVEWNKLGNGSSLEPHFSTLPLITRFDFCMIIAPAIIVKPDTMVCASAAEINCISDLDLMVNLQQIKLISELFTQFKNLISFDDLEEPEEPKHLTTSLNPDPTLNSRSSSLKNPIIESESDIAKDSGVEFDMSSVNSTNPGKPIHQEMPELPPFEFLVNCGKFTIIIYDVQRNVTFEYESNSNAAEEDDGCNDKKPLVYAMVDQPNFYLYQQKFDQKVQLSCFDIALCLGGKSSKSSSSIPTSSDFKIALIETKSGDPHPETGVPPSFVVMKYETSAGKGPQLSIDMGRPTKLHFSLSRLDDLVHVKNKLWSCLNREGSLRGSYSKCCSESSTPRLRPTPPSSATSIGGSLSSSIKFSLPDTSVTSRQLVLSFRNSLDDSELLLSLASFNIGASNVPRPERLFVNLSCDSFVVSAVLFQDPTRPTILLSPCSCSASLALVWEPWHNGCSPHAHLQADSDCVYLKLGPRHVSLLQGVVQDLAEVGARLFGTSGGDSVGNASQNDTGVSGGMENEETEEPTTTHEQHYKDDLKSGVFQFVDGNADELPFPYQVMFFSFPQRAMAWRYPHPRALTRIHVSPVPFESDESECNWSEDDRVGCAIEYWSESQQSFIRYVDFYLSECDSYRLELPERLPVQAVACVWRVILLPSAPGSSTSLPETTLAPGIRLSSKALLGCLRVDSYFNPRIVPHLQLTLSARLVRVSLYNHLRSNCYADSLPSPLQIYKLSCLIPEDQCYAELDLREACLMLSRWPDESCLLDAAGCLALHALDYGLLAPQELLDAVRFKARLSTGNVESRVPLDCSLSAEPFSLKLSPSAFHTLALSAYLWGDMLSEGGKGVGEALVLTTRYVIANDTNISVRFGQSGTDDSILLLSRQCHFYSWRLTCNQILRIAVEENGWSWSKPFSINTDGTYDADFSNASLDIVLTIHVTSLSATQKLITFSGQFIISNQLNDSFEMKLVKYDAAAKIRSEISRDVFNVPPNSQPPSIVLADCHNVAMRLRFSSIPNLSWTGDIPLQPNDRWGQPWLVKVPLQERGQFISIWVRIVIENTNGKSKILAITSPLYMIRSYLPVPAKVQIETPSLKVSLNAVINGRGEKQQLYCPGTFEHFHQLTFQIESGVSSSNPYVPLSYSSVDQRKFFKRPEKESIQDVLASLQLAKEDPKWPFQSDDSQPWFSADQPQTHVQVKYEDAGLASSTLLLELQPWCFILNSLGTQISVVSQDVELCRVPHYGVVAPPKLESTFHLGVRIADMFYLSTALQLVKPDWSQGFYMPRIQGLIPLEGNVKVCVDCGSSISMLSVNSSVYKDMRVMQISSNYVIGNMTDHELSVATLAISESLTDLHLPKDLTAQSIIVSPAEDQRYAVPIVQWHTLFEKFEESFVLYISLRLGNKSWSCPVRVDQSLSRRCIALPNGHSSIPLVITTQEDKSTVYIMIHVDKHPQLFISNMCSFKIIVGQANEELDNTVPDTQHFVWKCVIDSKSSCHYSMPTLGSKLPDLPNNNNTNEPVNMLMSALAVVDESNDKRISHWSRNIDLVTFPSEQIVRLPYYGDVKLIMRSRCFTTYLFFTSISQVEISAQEVRSKIEKKAIQPDEIDAATDELVTNPEEERILLNLQSASSSTSTTTYFSAQDEASESNSSIPTPCNQTFSLNESGQMSESTVGTLDLIATQDSSGSKIYTGSVTVHLQGFSIILLRDVNDHGQRIEVASLCGTDIIALIDYKTTHLNTSIYVGDLQFDNQLFEYGGFDFPVVFISQKPFVKKDPAIYLSNSLKKNLKNIIENSLLGVDLLWENGSTGRVCKEIALKIAPINAYIEGAFVTLLMDYMTSILPPCYIFLNPSKKEPTQSVVTNYIYIPDFILIDARILSHPLRLQNFLIEPVSVLLSVHTSVHLYVAFDHSPLYFEAFDRKNLITTPYRLGNALAMHYLSGAIFGVGWVVGSLEILGAPGGLAQALGSGLKDFISMPFNGLLQGPWGFIVGITHGSASLVKHVTAGTVNSVTKLASSVARNLDRLTLDDEHLQRQEEFRRMRPQGVAQGLYQGLTGFGMSLLAAVAGLAHHPLQQVWSGETSTRGIVTGVGRGLVGVVTKPLSGAAELVALTGQGLLQGTGWISLPTPRQRPMLQFSNGHGATSLRYAWRLMSLLEKSQDSILHVSNADHVMLQGASKAVTLILTRQALLIVNVAEDSVEKIYSLKDLVGADHPPEPTMFRLYCTTNSQSPPFRKVSPVEQTEIRMDKQMRARVAEFLRTSSTGIASVSTNSDAQSESQDAVSLPDVENILTFNINSDSQSYLLALFNLAKRQSEGSGFTVI